MSDFIRQKIGYHGPIVASQSQNLPASVAVLADEVDTVGVHGYWGNGRSPPPGDHTRWVANVPQAGVPSGGVFAAMGGYRVRGLPLIASETNTAHPSMYGAEHAIELAAAMRGQDWDGAYLYALSVAFREEQQDIPKDGLDPLMVVQPQQDIGDSTRMTALRAASRLALDPRVQPLPMKPNEPGEVSQLDLN